MTAFELTSPEAREHDRVPEWDDDPTPRGTVAAVLRAALELDVLRRRVCFAGARVLDLGAGFGCWSSELRKLAGELGWPVHITAIEINPARGHDLRKWCDEVVIGDWRDVLARGRAVACLHEDYLAPFDLVIGNPPFAELLRYNGEFPLHEDDSPAPESTMAPLLLKVSPVVLMLHTQQAFVKSGMGRAVQRHSPTAAAWQVPGAVSFREDGKQDSKCYEVSLWLRYHTGPCSRYLLDDLPSSERKWTTPPGSESPEWARANGYPLAPGYEGES